MRRCCASKPACGRPYMPLDTSKSIDWLERYGRRLWVAMTDGGRKREGMRTYSGRRSGVPR